LKFTAYRAAGQFFTIILSAMASVKAPGDDSPINIKNFKREFAIAAASI
jgi:hypothetical protein